MKSFSYVAAESVQRAVGALQRAGEQGVPVGGGTDLVGLMKNRVVTPELVVDLKTVDRLAHIEETPEGGLRIGAATTVADVQYHPRIRERFPLLHEAASRVASQQIRNQGTVGGNLCQRPRCWYYRNPLTPCLRRDHTYCSAVLGDNRYHAILGGAGCFIVHPSDLAPALIALDAEAVIEGPGGTKRMPLEKFFVLPRQDLHHENVLKPGEILAEVVVPQPMSSGRQTWLKFRTREVWDFAVLSVACQLQVVGTAIRDIRLVLGAVAPAPWRCHTAEGLLRGAQLTPDVVDGAIRAELAKARPMTHNAYKVELAAELMRRAILGD